MAFLLRDFHRLVLLPRILVWSEFDGIYSIREVIVNRCVNVSSLRPIAISFDGVSVNVGPCLIHWMEPQ